MQKEEEKFFEIKTRERKTSIALKRTENDKLALQSKLLETEERAQQYEE